ncbi:hypothetical protein CI109_106038 [Kwoniella shandongensis]|uniref:Uncharacterized protein n=1 Tax=Kwoniella shandongensis TaxID=1734106 RepID=A0A5M6BXV3_9TREE|nr:uncharacterized protein CI109_003913 [Kwoniella shandongensis]KAA5527654.1 hypothetical protein CI109_003913 [Kwoniella shandongensis]
MSPILKRDITDQVRYAKRFIGATTGIQHPSLRDDNDYEKALETEDLPIATGAYASSSSARQGIGVKKDEVEADYSFRESRWGETRSASNGGPDKKGKGKARDVSAGRVGDVLFDEVEAEAAEDGLIDSRSSQDGWSDARSKMGRMDFAEAVDDAGGQSGMGGGRIGKWHDLRSLLFEATPSLLLSLIGLVFTGELLEHLARWRVFRRVDELFILVPMIGNLKGNLEMCLSARLGTSANIGELDHRVTRRAMIAANMTLLGLQALLISCLAAVLSFALGLVTQHRLGDAPGDLGLGKNTTIGVVDPFDPGLASAGEEWHEGYTRPGWKQLVMVLATGMGSAGISSAVLGTFMGSLIVISRWAGADPDNITPPVAACLGDLLTLFILALLGTMLVGIMDTVFPLLAVIVMSIAAGWFTRRVMKNDWVKNVAKGSWAPLIGAMLISSGTGMVLDKGVAKYRGFALLAISMTGLTGSIGAIHANRLSTSLHTLLHPTHPRSGSTTPTTTRSSSSTSAIHPGLSPFQSSATLYLIAFPCQAAFLLFVDWAGWIDISLGWAGWLTFATTTLISLSTAHFMTLFFWSKNLDPDSYTLPIHSALVDFLGQLLLMVAYEICILQGEDVIVTNR